VLIQVLDTNDHNRPNFEEARDMAKILAGQLSSLQLDKNDSIANSWVTDVYFHVNPLVIGEIAPLTIKLPP
jgi:hypothetical protein